LDRELGKGVGQGGQRFWPQPVVSEAARWLGLHQACITKNPQMVGQVRLPGTRELDQVAGAQLLLGEELDDLASEWVGNSPD
jgi:hypothetical protein